MMTIIRIVALVFVCSNLTGICLGQTQTNTFPNTGNAGIGTTSPTYNLDIRTPLPKVQLMESTSGGNRRLQISVGGEEEIRFMSTFGSGGTYPFTFRFGGSSSEVMRITPNRRVGIGVAAPLETLHVKGYTMFQRPDGANYIKIHSGISGNYITSNDPGTNQKNLIFQVVSSPNENGGRHMYFQTGTDSETFLTRMVIRSNGNVGIGTGTPQAKLAVNGDILATEVKIKTDITVPDYVFEPDYNLPTLAEVEAHIQQHKHLPEIPSAADIERDGLNLAEMNLLLLKKVEELTLHLIEKEKTETQVLRQLSLMESQLQRVTSRLGAVEELVY